MVRQRESGKREEERGTARCLAFYEGVLIQSVVAQSKALSRPSPELSAVCGTIL